MARRKARNDSAAGKQELMKAARSPIEPVQELAERAMYYFQHYASTRPSFDWSKGDIVRLTKLSERMAEVDVLSEQVKADGVMVRNNRGTPVVNPAVTARDQLERTCMAMEKTLSVFAPMSGSKKQSVFDQACESESLKANNDNDLLA